MLLTSRRLLAWIMLALGAITVAAFALPAGTSSAHNALVSSDPADGASLVVAPAQVTWTFDRSVPLETLTVTLIDTTGARSELAGSTHGPSGDTQVVTPLPALQPGDVSLRWRLVGARWASGHRSNRLRRLWSDHDHCRRRSDASPGNDPTRRRGGFR
jgi:methionine-rich copper-binding protein CopC